MSPRLFIDDLSQPLAEGSLFALPPSAARHVQVLRLQPGAPVVLFDGQGGEWAATVLRMGRSEVDVRVGPHIEVDRELELQVTLALGVPANDRMDAVVEKCTELGARAFVPLVCERSVLRVSGERADRKTAHWQAVASSAAEQSGRTRVPLVQPVSSLSAWLSRLGAGDGANDGTGREGTEVRWLLGFRGATPIAACMEESGPALARPGSRLIVLSGPEGGLAEAEESMAVSKGFRAVSLGDRVLRADTAPMAVMAVVGMLR